MKTSIAVLMLLILATPVVAAGDLQEDLVAIEKGLWTAWGNKDGAPFLKHLTEDHVQIIAGAGMVAGREAVAADVSQHNCETKSFEFHDAKVRQLSPDVAILSYKATQDTVCDGEPLPPTIYSTSVYIKKDGAWLSASYQETPVE